MACSMRRNRRRPVGRYIKVMDVSILAPLCITDLPGIIGIEAPDFHPILAVLAGVLGGDDVRRGRVRPCPLPFG